MHHRSRRTPSDGGREFSRNPLSSDSRSNPITTIERPRNRMTVRAVRHTMTAVGTVCLAAACQESNAPEQTPVTMPSGVFSQASNASKKIADEYIVVFKDDVSDVAGRAKGLANANGASVNRTYSSAL